MDTPALSDGVVLLWHPLEEDKQHRLSCGADPELVRMYGGNLEDKRLLSAEEAEVWYEKVSSGPLSWVIETEGLCIGEARLHSLDQNNRRARYAIGIFNRGFWARGLGTRVTKLILQYAFEELHLHRVDLRVLSYNQRAIACFKKCGFTEEGVERDGALVAGEWHSDIMMSVLDHEYWK